METEQEMEVDTNNQTPEQQTEAAAAELKEYESIVENN